MADTLEAKKSGESNDKRIVRAWKETWEYKMLKPSGDPILEARLCRKYGGLKWEDPNNQDKDRPVHPDRIQKRVAHPDRMWFQKQRGNNRYNVLATLDEYDFSKEPGQQDDVFEAWEINNEFFECVTEYYQKIQN